VVDGKVKLTTVHHAHTPEITLISPTTAKGVWAMEDLLWWRTATGRSICMAGAIITKPTSKIGGNWFIQSRVLTRLRVDSTPDFQSYLDA